ncbi:M6 family metalloprotease domain-containing protein [Streptomyces pacificus]|uniref:M6 family metalloprotease domain-containing protein n=1 Tax=Streptomyces pacificus TaxID=2705029 RepID=A0A6A0AP03_9ACTN|nr:M6 family metalloprotease domain-containing protein [Streptomyces pacificus]
MEGQQALEDSPKGVERSSLRAGAAAFTSLVALAATTFAAGPASADPSPRGCALARTAAHHSLGLDSWNSAYPRPDRAVDAVMVFLSFPDSTPLTTPDDLVADHFPATSDFFRNASYGRFLLRPHPVRRWIRMPRPSTEYRIKRDWDAGLRAAYLRDAVSVVDPLVDFSRYDVIYLVADPDAPGVDSDATKVVNFERATQADGAELKRAVTVFERHPPDRHVLAHETGHVFDLPDLYHRPADGKGDWDTHVGDWDVMGSQFGLAPELLGWHKWKLGWLDESQVRCVTGPADRVLELEPLAAAPVPGRPEGTRLAVVRTGQHSALAIEARGATGNDRDTCREGVLLYRVRNEQASGAGPVEVIDTHPGSGACWGRSVYPQLADAPLGVGESFTVPGERVRVEVADRARTGAWKIKITPVR